MSRGNVRVRAAQARDVDSLTRLTLALRQEGIAAGRAHWPRGDGPDELPARFLRLIDDPVTRVVLAVDQESDEALGMAILSRDEINALAGVGVVHLSHLFVAPAHRRRGVGRALVAAAAGYAEGLGCEHVIVGVMPGGREANRYLARLGFGPLLTVRIASVCSLSRNLGAIEPGRDRDAVGRRTLRPVRMLTGPTRRLRRGVWGGPPGAGAHH